MEFNPIRKRAGVVAQIKERAVGQNGLLVSITGHAGTGKTWLLRALSAAMDEHSTVHFVTADEYEKDESYSFIERILSTGIAPVRTIDSSLQPVAVARQALEYLHSRARTQVQTIIVDDAQWIDSDSAQVLRYLIPRVMRQGLLFVMAGRTPDLAASPLQYLDTLAEANPTGLRHELGPLDADEIRALGQEYFGVLISPHTAKALQRRTGGLFLGIDSIFRQVTVEEKSQLHLVWDLPIRGHRSQDDPLLAEFRTLEPAARTAVEIVSTADAEVSPAQIRQAAAELGEDCDVSAAVTAGVLSESGFGSTIIPRHALIAHAVRETLSSSRLRELSRALAPTARGFHAIVHTLNGSVEWGPELASAVSAYVDDAVESRNVDAANDVLRRSLRLSHGDVHDRLLCRLGLINLRNKTMFYVLDLLPEFEALPESPLRECLVLTLLAHRTDLPFPRERLHDFLSRPGDDAEMRTMQAFAAFLSVITTMRTRDYTDLGRTIAAAQVSIAAAPTDPSAVADPDLRWMVTPKEYSVLLETYATVGVAQDYDTAAVARMVDDLAARVSALPPTALKVDAIVPLAGAAVGAGDLGRAHALAATGVALLDTVDKPWAGGTLRVIHAHVSSLLGSLDEVRDLIDLAEEFMPTAIDVETRMSLQGLRAWIDAASGHEQNPGITALAERLEAMSWEAYAADMMVIADCEIARARQDPQAVLAASKPDRTKRMLNSQRGFLTYRAHALIDLERWEEAADLIDQLAALRGSAWQEYWGTLDWIRARFAAAQLPDGQASPEITALYESACGSPEYPLAHALTLRDFGIYLGRSGDVPRARTILSDALRTFGRIGAHAYAPQVRMAFDLLPVKEKDLLRGLTAREREIGTLVAAGRSNKEIAAELFVATATVRYHVSNLLRKLHLTRRSEVAVLLQESGAAER